MANVIRMSAKRLFFVGGSVLLLALLALNTLRLGLGADMRAECAIGSYPRSMAPEVKERDVVEALRGAGIQAAESYVVCDFANMGYVPGRICAAARVAPYGSGDVSVSRALCSGILWPLTQATEMEPDQAGMFCFPDKCAVTTVPWP